MVERAGQQRAIGTIGAGLRVAHESEAFLHVDGDILACIEPLAHLATPGTEGIEPGDHREAVALVAERFEAAFPAVAIETMHRSFEPVGVAFGAVQQRGSSAVRDRP